MGWLEIKKFFTVFVTISGFIIILFIIYWINNLKPERNNKILKNIEYNTDIITNYEIKNKDERKEIYLDIDSRFFKKHNYCSYISGEATGIKINLEIYLISNNSNYKIKTQCYEHSDLKIFKFLGYYAERFIKKHNEKYKIAIYIPENEILYITDIQV